MTNASYRWGVSVLLYLLVTTNLRVLAFSSSSPQTSSTSLSPAGDETVGKSKPAFPYTGIRKEIVWNELAPPVAVESEKALRASDVLIRPGEFGQLTDERKEEIAQVSQIIGISLPQALNIRKQTLVSQIAYSSYKLKHQGGRLSKLLLSKGIVELSCELGQPPVSIIREILMYRITSRIDGITHSWKKKLVRSIIYNELADPHLEDFLSPHEQEQLSIAKASDVVSYIDQDASQSERAASGAWEQSLYGFLDEHSIAYWNEDQLRSAGATSTPDCLFLDDVTINGRPTRWVDCKNFFGYSAAKHFLGSLRKQTDRYNDYFGAEGAIVYRDGFSVALELQMSGALILDRGPLLDCYDENIC